MTDKMARFLLEDAKLQSLSAKFEKQMHREGFDYLREIIITTCTTFETLFSSVPTRNLPIFTEDKIYGSVGEGIVYPLQMGSRKDIDIVHVSRNCVALESVHDIIHDYAVKCIYLIENEQTLPGYCYLRKINESSFFGFPNVFCPMTLEINGIQFLSSSAITNFIRKIAVLSNAPSEAISLLYDLNGSICNSNIGNQGPSIHYDIASSDTFNPSKIDNVFAIPCPKWPSCASTWITRRRLYDWPTEKLIKEIITQGIYFAPVGSKDHPRGGLQWRYSFNEAERRLVRSFNTTQAKCYALLKRLVTENVTPQFQGEDVISSYHLKTLMFWKIEETDSAVWIPSNLIQCVFLVLDRLVQCVNSRNCPSYFIADENLFLFKVTPEKKDKLLACINCIVSEGWPVLGRLSNMVSDPTFIWNIQQECDTHDNVQDQTIVDRFLSLNVDGLLESVLLPYYLIQADVFKLHESDRIRYTFNAVINQLIIEANACHNASSKKTMINVIAMVCSSYGTHCLSLSRSPTVKFSERGELEDLGDTYIELSCLREQVNCLAKHASYAYMRGNLESTLTTACNIIQIYFNQSVAVYSTYSPLDVQLQAARNRIVKCLVEKDDISDRSATTYISQTSKDVIFMKNEIYAVPGNAIVEMFKIGHVLDPLNPLSRFRQCFVVDPYLYVTYLAFLVYYDKELHEEADKLIRIMEMICSVPPNSHMPSSLNLLGDCYLKRGKADVAFEKFSLSMQRNSRRNAAPWHVARLLWRKLLDRWLRTRDVDD